MMAYHISAQVIVDSFFHRFFEQVFLLLLLIVSEVVSTVVLCQEKGDHRYFTRFPRKQAQSTGKSTCEPGFSPVEIILSPKLR